MNLDMGVGNTGENITKSFVPGKGYVKATEAGVKVLRRAAKERPAHFEDAKLTQELHNDRFKEGQKAIHGLLKQTSNRGTMSGASIQRPRLALGIGLKASGTKGFMVRTGSAKGGTSHVILPKDAPQHIVNHEMTHAAPKRSSYRMHQIVTDPKKLMREEARAEMGSNRRAGYYRTYDKTNIAYTQAAQSEPYRQMAHETYASQPGAKGKIFEKENVQAFKDVQDKIGSAREKQGSTFKKVPGTNEYKASGRKAYESRNYTPDSLPRHTRVIHHVKDNSGKYAFGTGAVSIGGFKGNQWMDRRRQKRVGVHKSFETLDMGGAMVTETPKRDLPVRDLQTGRFVGTPHLQKLSRAHDSLVWEKDRTDG